MSMNISVAGIAPGEPCVNVTLNLSRAITLQLLAQAALSTPETEAFYDSRRALAESATEAVKALQGMGAT